MLPAAFTFFAGLLDADVFLSPLVLAATTTFLAPPVTFFFPPVTFLAAVTFLPLPPPPSSAAVCSTRSFRFFDGTESASLRQASSLAAPSQDLFVSNRVPFEARPSFLAGASVAFSSVV